MHRGQVWYLLAAIVFLPGVLLAQAVPHSFDFNKTVSDASDRPLSNSAVEFLVRGDTVWVGGGKGLSYTVDNGASWVNFGGVQPFDHQSIAAIGAYANEFWISLAGSFQSEQGSIPQGLGLAYSTDSGLSWTHIEQPRESEELSTVDIQYGVNTIKALAITTDINNITYDIAVTSKAVWTASFAGGLRKSTDGGNTFTQVVLPPDFLDAISPDDTLNFELSPVNRPDLGLRESLNHRVFSVHAMGDDTIWVGTAGGINLSVDGGESWRKFSFDNQNLPISGNFVVAINSNEIAGQQYVWAATNNARTAMEFRAISFSTDFGESWQTTLRGEFNHNIGFMGEVVYAATDGGIYRSDDAGMSWIGFSHFVDTESRQVATDERCYAMASIGDVVWVANADGLMRTRDAADEFFGTKWKIFRAATPVGTPDFAYAYPSPFSPSLGVCRIRYRSAASGKVDIRIFDFAMLPVRTLLNSATRTPDTEHDEVWDGSNDSGNRVANGVYYIQVTLDDRDPVWTKVIVLQ